ncbi:hypothetical protein HDR60_00295 [bacterium]|nr:hypothetical protein [bacterium]MDE6224238.1 toxin co-regulated pilus biosynthesis Q family protein [Alphaproteobacteria bacterium]
MKISKLSIAVIAISVLLFSGKTFADWGVEAYEDDYYDDTPVWPMPYTDAYTNIDVLAENPDYSANVPSKGISKEPETGWTGGPNYTPPLGNPPVTENIIPPADSNMPLANKDLVVDDGVRVLSASMPPGYPLVEYYETKEVIMEDENNKILQDSVRDWIAKEGQTLREVLEQWASIEGWELVWNTKREYPLKASAIFRGRFKDVSAAIIRTFSRATPQPLAKYYLGNRVLVIKTLEENDG